MARLPLLQDIEHCANLWADLFLFVPTDGLTDHLAGFAILTVTDELLQLFVPGQFAELHRAIDR